MADPNVESVSDPELLARYCFNRSHISDDRAKYALFLPLEGETSVFRIQGLTDDIIWKLADQYVSPFRKASLKGRADVLAGAVRALDLDVKPDTEGQHRRHAVIVGWPDNDEDETAVAVELAKVATVKRRQAKGAG